MSGALRVTLADSAGSAVLTLAPTSAGWAGRLTTPNAAPVGAVTLVRQAGCGPE
jgi:hypothetical protein